ncbi:MAG: SDR family oxidoreductase [Gammaproteobacteria bacterium]|jgi:3-oxoacyl-[acyl-carrier protein] reductase|nr:MAG: SDR family oxidoreductase [Gammaproteobacteria bacterium]
MNRLEGKTALITGAARGLGARIAERFAEEGADVIINDLSLTAAEDTAKRLGGRAVAADVSDSASVAAMFESVAEMTDHLDILVNNAGISGIEGDNDAQERIRLRAEAMASGEEPPAELVGGIVDVTDEKWHRMLAVHMDGTFFCCRGAVPLMPDGAAIINMGSIMGTFGRGGGLAYCAAKAGILGFTRALAHELAPRNIRVNGIAPGWIHTDMTAPMAAMHPLLEMQTPMGRMGEPDDIAWCAVYLASPEAGFVTGQTLSPNGGWYMSQ